MVKLIDDVTKNSVSLPVLLFGEYAYKLGMNKSLRDIR
jgi:hypothetical protein